MNTERHITRRKRRGHHEHGETSHYRESFLVGRELGQRGHRAARQGDILLQSEEMRERIDEMDRRISRHQAKSSFRSTPHFEERETQREIVRTRRNATSDWPRGDHRHGPRMRAEGRRMGRMMNRAFARSRHSRDERHLDT